MKRSLLLMLLTAAASYAQAPLADHHQHLFSPAMAQFGNVPTPITAQDLIRLLDEAGIKRGVLLSTAYSYGRPSREPQNEYEKVREENDWVGAQAALYPKRLIAFCSFNPLKDYALTELERCAKKPDTRRGIKLHFGNSDVQLDKPEHVERLKAVFRAANANRMAIVVHARVSISLDRPYGAEQARAFVNELLPLMTRSAVQIAHLGSSGPGYGDPKVDAFMDAFFDALGGNSGNGDSARKSKMKNVWFDITTIAHPSNTPERSAMVTKRIRQIGVDRILYGTDAAFGSNLKPRESWAEFTKVGLTAQELKTISSNRAPYMP